ncbi:unnamed protein product [Allacma fusca]|uniref:Uncharacterized protein n=1 Tax=Allacma fusca TaxID=39272 RepID=A0A8J2NPB7_9HEXA|nr:unnamed protein product [Allacma fusca]
MDNYDLIVPREVIEGPRNSPVLTKTELGWLVAGDIAIHKSRVDPDIVFTVTEETDDLHGMVKDFFNSENFGAEFPSGKSSTVPDRAMDIQDDTTKRIGQRFETGLLWGRIS